MKLQKNKSETETLSQIVDELQINKYSNTNSSDLNADILSLLYELQVHKLELELQNEALLHAREKAEIASKKYNALFDFAPIGYFTISKKSTINALNLIGATMLGKKRSQLKNKQFNAYVSADTKPVFDLFLSRIFSGSAQETCEITLKPDGTLPIYVNLNGIITEDGYECMITANDITQQKKAEQSLAKSEEKFRLLFEEALTGDFILTEQGVLLDCNPSFLQIFGYAFKEEIIGKNITSFYKDISEFERIKSELKKNKILIDYETTRKRKNGDLIHIIENIVARFNSEGEISEIKGYLNDITDRKKAESDLKIKNKELEILIAEKDKFFSILAHDLRGPFNGFLGLTEIIALESLTLETDEVQKMGETLWRSATNLFKLLENLLQWSQMEQGLIPYNPGLIRLYSFVAENMMAELETAQKKNIIVKYNIPGDIFVLADAKMLRSILGNLFSNATKFTPKGGKIFVSARHSALDQIEISIKDTGIGMCEDIQNRLFRLNEQINRKGTDGELSTGLGLFLCKDFIEKHAGTIQFESKEGMGSTFSFTVPCIS